MDSSLGGLSRSSTVASLDTDSTKSSGQSDFPRLCLRASPFLFIHPVAVGNSASEAYAEFRVKYVGAIEKLEFNMSKTLQEPLDLIGYIDAAQVRSRRRDSTVQERCCKICSLFSKTGSCLSFPETERWSWVCPSTASKWPHWTNA